MSEAINRDDIAATVATWPQLTTEQVALLARAFAPTSGRGADVD